MNKDLIKCVCCESSQLTGVFDFGEQCLVNSYDNSDRYPLKLNRCKDCNHLQLSIAVSPEILFKNYAYMSGVSDTMKRYYRWFADKVSDENPDAKTVYEIASNDGAQLDELRKVGFDTFGIDPADNMCQVARAKGHVIECDFLYHSMIKYDVLIAQNVIAHVSDPYEFLLNCKARMRYDSTLYVQTSQVDMLKFSQFDTIYHEHISFFCVSSMVKLLERVGLYLQDISRVEVHGGSYIYTIKRLEYSLWDMEYHAEKFKETFLQVMKSITGKVIGYGASAKGVNLINYTGWKPDFIIDDTPTKQGKRLACSGVEIFSREKLKEITEDVFFIPLAWNFYDEIVEKIKALRPNNKDRFIKYVPDIEIQ